MKHLKNIKRVVRQAIELIEAYKVEQEKSIWSIPYPKISHLQEIFKTNYSELEYWYDRYLFMCGEANQQGRWSVVDDYSNRIDQLEAQFNQINEMIPTELKHLFPAY